jgi:hypothetical protein
MYPARPAAVPPWWHRRDASETHRSRRVLVLRVAVMLGLLAVLLSV